MVKKIQFKLKYYNIRLIIYLLMISSLGVALIGSATPGENEYKRQIVGLVAGFIIMVVISIFNYDWVLKYHWIIYILCLAILGIVLVAGKEVKGATRWIAIGSFATIQPSEFAKVMMIVFWAWLYGKNKVILQKWKWFLLTSLLSFVPIMLVFMEPDLSTTILFVILFISVLFIGGLSYKKIGICLSIILPIAIGLIIYIQTPNQKLLTPNQMMRIDAFLHPENNVNGKYQQENSVLAIGSGELTGKGLYNDNVDSVKNGNYLSESETDFIFAIVGEELGFVGSCGILLLMFLITFECIITGIKSIDLAGRIICFGMASITTFQTFINVGVATDILPNTGIPLPFVSSGLSSLVAMFAGMGFVLNVRMRKRLSMEEGSHEHRANST